MAEFLRANSRWLVGGLLLTFFSSVGQTFFISLFAGEIRQEFALSHGDFGALYMMATLGSAISLIFLGRLLDRYRIVVVALGVIAALALAAALMSISRAVAGLLLALYLLRLFGQGMMSQTAMVAMGRWFVRGRGRAVSIAAIGYQLGEGILPLLVVSLMVAIDWRMLWLLTAIILVVVAAPACLYSLQQPRKAASLQHDFQSDNLESVRQWTLSEVLRDAPFWIVGTGVLAPAFIGTSVYFHQVHLAEIKGWGSSVIAASFVLMALSSVSVGLVTGHLIDRASARHLLPYFLMPLSIACIVLSTAEHPLTMSVFMLLLGTSYGLFGAVFGAIWPEVYGIRHLGSIRSVVSAAMVFASAVGPGVTGYLIDSGIGFELQLLVMSIYCLLTMLILFRVSGLLKHREVVIEDRQSVV